MFTIYHCRTISENEVTHKLPSEAPETRDEALAKLAVMQDKLDQAKQRLDAKTAFFMSSEKSQPGDKYQGILEFKFVLIILWCAMEVGCPQLLAACGQMP